MAETSTIEWTDATWNPVTGCSVVSPGCTNCYAMRLAGTRLAGHPSRAGLTRDSKAGPVWNGTVRLNEEWLSLPLRWKRPRRIFVCAHGDLFAEGVEDDWIDRVFAVMALAPRHIFQVLTKRPERLRRYLGYGGTCIPVGIRQQAERAYGRDPGPLPIALPNVWLGVSCEDQQRADERIPDLLATPAAVRWVSAEPLLGPIDFRGIAADYTGEIDALNGLAFCQGRNEPAPIPRLDWIVAGGESGSGARPMKPAWARGIRDQCEATAIAFFFKQWGEYEENNSGHAMTGRPVRSSGGLYDSIVFDDGARMNRVGKAAAGRLLDGRTWDQMPGQAA